MQRFATAFLLLTALVSYRILAQGTLPGGGTNPRHIYQGSVLNNFSIESF